MSFNQSKNGKGDLCNYELEYKQIKSYLDADNVEKGFYYIDSLQRKLGHPSKNDQLVLDVLTCIIQNKAYKIKENLDLIAKLDGSIKDQLMLIDFTIAKADTFWKSGKQQEALPELEKIEEEISNYKNGMGKNDLSEISSMINDLKK